jgi:hypothetical protein
MICQMMVIQTSTCHSSHIIYSKKIMHLIEPQIYKMYFVVFTRCVFYFLLLFVLAKNIMYHLIYTW